MALLSLKDAVNVRNDLHQIMRSSLAERDS